MTADRTLYVLLFFGCATLVASGCGDAYQGRCEVSGKVNLKGKPLDDGSIDFLPLDSGGPENLVTKAGVPIQNGVYLVTRERGLVPGKYKVIITSPDGRTPAIEGGVPGPTGANIVSKDRIPSKYNVASKQEVEVTQKGPNVFDYDIP